MDWSLLGCGARGHVTFAPDEPALRERLTTATADGESWRCLRCGTFVIGPPVATGPASGAPRVRRGKELRSAFILRVFAVERFLRAILFTGLAIGVWRFAASRMSVEQAYDRELPAVRTLLRQLGFNVNHNKLLGLIQHAFTLNSHTLTLLAVGAALYAVLEIVEGTGLWLLKRWGEYFAMVATSIFLPYEIYDLTAKVTVLRLLAFLINLALVIYLVLAKRLFGARGGKKAYEAALRSQSILDAEIAAVAAAPAASPAEQPSPETPAPERDPAPADQPEGVVASQPDGVPASQPEPAAANEPKGAPATEPEPSATKAPGAAGTSEPEATTRGPTGRARQG
jgi:uncharacterized membrane protein (DUF2068 family)